MQEQDEFNVGIRAYLLNEGAEIKGITKYRFSDFVVNEVDEKRNLVYYDKNLNQDLSQFESAKIEKQTELPQEQQAELKSLLDTESYDKVIKFVYDIFSGDNSLQKLQITCPEDKDIRTKVHHWIRNHLQSFFSETSNDKKYIEISYKKNNKNVKRISKDQAFLHCTLWKSNTDTYQALNLLSKNIRKQITSFGFAGNKDKRGITTQRISIFHGNVEAILKNEQLKKMSNQLRINDFSLHAKDLSLGELYGNRFSIAIRFINNQPKDIIQRVDHLKQNGFINYFGMQRFGSGNTRTHDVGKLILLKRYEEAFYMILKQNFEFSQKDIDQSINELKSRFIQEKDFSILQSLPFKYKIERAIIEGLKRSKGNDFLGGIMNLPKNSRELYPHAYQVIFQPKSYLWNRVASERIEQFGLKVQKGDLILEDGNFKAIQFPEQYRIEDIVIPVLGSETQQCIQLRIPQNSIIHKLYSDILQEDEVTWDTFKNIEKQFHVSGSHRQLISIPEDVQYSIVRFDEQNQDLITDDYKYEKDFESDLGKYQALLIKFTLKKSNYATMFIRELTRVSSSFSNQQIMNQNIDQELNE